MCQTGGSWYCPCCQHGVTLDNLETHMATQRHQRAAHYAEVVRQNNEMQAAGRCPPWMEIRKGYPWCKVCWTWGTDGHLTSRDHEWRAAHPEDYGVVVSSSKGKSAEKCASASGASACVKNGARTWIPPPPREPPPVDKSNEAVSYVLDPNPPMANNAEVMVKTWMCPPPLGYPMILEPRAPKKRWQKSRGQWAWY